MSLSLIFNPLAGEFQYVDSGNAVWGAPVADLTALNAINTDAPWTVRVVESVNSAYVWTGSAWAFLNLVKTASVGASPNAQGYTLASDNTLTLQPANGSNPGVITTGAQTLSGTKTFSSLLNADGGIDRSTAGTLSFGTNTATSSVVNIGNANATVNIQGTTIFENTTTLNVANPTINLNTSGAVGSGSNSGITVEENAIITGYAETSADRNSWTFKAPNTAGIASLTPGSTNDSVALLAATQTLTNKTIDAASNTLSNITNANLNGSAAITNANLASMANNTVKANKSGVSATPNDVALGSLSETVSSVLTITGANTLVGSTSIQVSQSTTSTSGYLSSTDWNTFNNKQPAGNYITALTGDVVASGPGSASSTIQPNVVTNAKLAQMPANTIKGNNTGTTANALDLTVSQVNTLLGTVTTASAPLSVSTGNVSLTGIVSPANGGTGVANSSTLTFGPNTINLNTGGPTSITLPTSGTLAIVSAGDINETAFSLANNQVAPADITGLSFAGSVKGAEILYSIVINATTNLFEVGTALLCNVGTGWQMTTQSVGNSSNVVLSVTSGGQVQYTTPNYPGFTSGTILFRAWAI